MSSSDFCEIRVPTYKRPLLLKRALQSLQAQTYTHWRCVVFDDSPQAEGQAVVEDLGDARIAYRKNSVNLGISGNLKQCFQTCPIMGGSFACVLDDDNYLMPEYLMQNIAELEEYNASILLRNQRYEFVGDEEENDSLSGYLSNRTNLSVALVKKVYSGNELLFSLFLGGGAPNGTLFWRTNFSSDLELGSEVPDPIVQEHVRTFFIQEKAIYGEEGLAVFRYHRTGSYRFYRDRKIVQRIRRRATIAYLRRLAIQIMETEKPLRAWIDDLPQGFRPRMVEAVLLSGHFLGPTASPRVYLLWLAGLTIRLVPPQLSKCAITRINRT